MTGPEAEVSVKGKTTIRAQVRALSREWPAPEQAWLEAFVEAIRNDYAQVVRRDGRPGSAGREGIGVG